MRDIVKRLRDIQGQRIADYWALIQEAADTIEIMAREIAELKAQHLLTQAEAMHRTVEEAEAL